MVYFLIFLIVVFVAIDQWSKFMEWEQRQKNREIFGLYYTDEQMRHYFTDEKKMKLAQKNGFGMYINHLFNGRKR